MLSQANTACTLAPGSSHPIFLRGSLDYTGCVGEAPHTFRPLFLWRLQLAKGSQGESRLGINDLVTAFPPPAFLAGLLFMLITRRSPTESK